jgi:hypothetical protein
LTWKTSVREINASPKDDVVEGSFPFKNTGNYPVTILKLERPPKLQLGHKARTVPLIRELLVAN